jgi:hypothetical protein
VNCEPGTAGLQVASAEDIRIVRPPPRILRRTRVKLIAISRDDQRQFFMLSNGDDQ